MKKPTTTRMSEAKRRVEEAQRNKIKVRIKPGSKPVLRPTPKEEKATNVDGLPLKEMLKQTTARTRELMRKGDVQVINMKPSRTGRSLLSQTVTRHPQKPNTYYNQTVTNEDSRAKRFTDSRRLKVECTCPQFKFTHDWTLHQKDASDLNYSIDEPSLIRNPQQLHGVCKHLLRVFNAIVASRR